MRKERTQSCYCDRGLGKVVWECCLLDDTVKGLCMESCSCDYGMTGVVFSQFGVSP